MADSRANVDSIQTLSVTKEVMGQDYTDLVPQQSTSTSLFDTLLDNAPCAKDADQPKLSKTSDKEHRCDICSKRFPCASKLMRHIRSHTGEKPFKCDICHKRFGSNSDVLKHQRVHTGEKPYKCTICLKQFGFFHSLKQHHRIHTGEKPYQCEVCQKTFNQTSSLQKHMRTMHSRWLNQYMLLWNSLPFYIKALTSVYDFKSSLITHYCHLAFQWIHNYLSWCVIIIFIFLTSYFIRY